MKLFSDDSFTVRFEAAKAYGLTFGNWFHVIGICLEMLKDSDYTNRLVGAENLLELKPYIQNDLDVIAMAVSTASWESRLDLEEVLHQLRSSWCHCTLSDVTQPRSMQWTNSPGHTEQQHERF